MTGICRDINTMDVPERAKRLFSGRNVVVMGLGRTGRSVSLFLRRCGADVIATDILPLEGIEGVDGLSSMGIRIEAGGHREDSLERADLVVVSPGIPLEHPFVQSARRRGIEITGELELATSLVDIPIVAVTGTNGKTTTTTLIGEVMKRAGRRVFVCGNIGRPAVEYFEGGEPADVMVIEVSSFNLETIKTFHPTVAVLLNITEDHMDRYTGFEEYKRVKFRIFDNQEEGDRAIVNTGDPSIKEVVSRNPLKAGILPFTSTGTLREGIYLEGDTMVCLSEAYGREEYPLGDIKLKGIHNIENMMATVATARCMGIGREIILDTINNFTGLPHRMELVRSVNGIEYINDSKATNVGALVSALRGIKGQVVLIAGGKDKGIDYTPLGEVVRRRVKTLVLMGEARERIREACRGVDCVLVDSMEEAVGVASQRAERGDTVLLSPACSSFDMFRDYRHRGDVFRRLVERI